MTNDNEIMTNERAISFLREYAFALRDGTKYIPLRHEIMFRQAYEMAIEALKDKWIPVSDRVPEDDRLVIVCTEWGYVYTDYYFEDNPEFWELAHIIAWQDLPSAYKKEDK